ncbi:MAG: tripartite tricarboxylate transporter substrate binding protein [Acidovorax sp.]|uniref:Bug family tripartite tricarboxylate transporter substrate binding protein n=1 Tax=Acidovorax sp. TaxID=1872122 RepID=UPI000A676223|nr:tripartite tricarboxylate transporter substrate binding protein [Acidovorax sp.]MDH4427193.1 tripartite tricarboxylate transporter substrate binding protein [Acidovorax sp.]MDH4465694.1 tripartite tricarboxylate transporter substrate binding protein [Acidovorax sp.]
MFTRTLSPMRRRLIQSAAIALCAMGAIGTAQAQAWPTKPIKIVVGFAPGGTTDVMARVMAQSLSEALGQPVVVDNKPGASSNLAAAEVIRAPADGHTFLVSPTSVETANPFLFKQTISPAKDLTPVAGVGRSQMYLVVKPQSTFKDAKELVAFARANPGKMSYASAGPGTPPHLAGELFKKVTGVFATHIPYRGAAPALQDVMSNQADYVFDPGIAFPHVRAGKVRMLAVAGAKRSSFFPDVPTLAELGFKGAELDIWFGMWAPNGTPADVTARMAREIAKVLALPATKSRYESLGAEPVGMDNAEFRTLLAEEAKLLSGLIQEAKINID